MNLPKPILVSIGILCRGMGSAGIVLPLVPTTLFWAADCFAKVRTRFVPGFSGTSILAPEIKKYREKGGITRRTRVIALSLLWLSISLSAFTTISCWTARAVLSAVAAAVTFHLLSLKNYSLR